MAKPHVLDRKMPLVVKRLTSWSDWKKVVFTKQEAYVDNLHIGAV